MNYVYISFYVTTCFFFFVSESILLHILLLGGFLRSFCSFSEFSFGKFLLYEIIGAFCYACVA